MSAGTCERCARPASDHIEVRRATARGEWLCASCFDERPRLDSSDRRGTANASGFSQSWCDPLVPPTRHVGPTVAFAQADLVAVAALWGGVPESIPCPFPDHQGMASLFLRHEMIWVDCCRHRTRTAAQAMAARAWGFDARYSGVQLAIWWRELGRLVGAISPLPVPMPPVPASWSPTRRRVIGRFGTLASLLWHDGAIRPLVYAPAWAATWAGCGKSTAHRAIRDALAAGILRPSGCATLEVAYGEVFRPRDATLYLPGLFDVGSLVVSDTASPKRSPAIASAA